MSLIIIITIIIIHTQISKKLIFLAIPKSNSDLFICSSIYSYIYKYLLFCFDKHWYP
jgi:hypothetical protein